MTRWVHPAWKVLGIDPTSDPRAIRVAYSARLKAIDPEQDPKAFIALREAFEAAKVQAQWVDLQDEEDEDEAWDEAADGEDRVPSGDLYQIRPSAQPSEPPPADPAWETPEPPQVSPEPHVPESEAADSYWQGFTQPEKPERPSPWAPISPADADAHAHALATLLYSHDRERDPWPTAAQEEEMLVHWRAIAADPRMQEVSFFADAERWFSELIARTAAFSDPLVIPATEYFRWLGSDGTIAQTPAIAYVTRRYRMLEFQQAVKQPRHPLYPAWRELVRRTGNRTRRGSVSGRKVRQLLRIVRTHYPDLEGCFDAYRVALWDGSHIGTGSHGSDNRPFWNWGCLWIPALILVGLIALAMIGDRVAPYRPPPVSELQNPRPDIDVALEKLFGDKLDIASVEAENPALARSLMAFWTEQHDQRETRMGFTGDLDRFLAGWFRKGVRKAEPALLAEYHRFRIDVATALLAADPAGCQAFLSGASAAWDNRDHLSPALLDRERAIEARVLLATDGSTDEAQKQSTVPGALVEAAARRAHVSHDAMAKSLLFEGPPRDQCVNRIAFAETVLALPAGKQRTALLRHM